MSDRVETFLVISFSIGVVCFVLSVLAIVAIVVMM